MRRSARPALLVGNAVVLAAIALTFRSDLGRGRRDLDLVLAALVALAAVATPLLARRRLTTLLLASAASWSTLSGVFVYYVSPGLPGGRWMLWWHTVTSVAFALAFLAHWARNHPRLVALARGAFADPSARGALLVASTAVAVGLAWSAFAARHGTIDEEAYDALGDASFWALAVLVVLAGTLLLAARRGRPRAWPEGERNALRGGVDSGLLATMLLASVSGLALLYARQELRAIDGYWWTKAWHVVLSAMLVALALAHSAFNARPLASHAR